jgi:hypothetical protein
VRAADAGRADVDEHDDDNSALQEARDSRAASDDALLTRARAEHGDAKAIASTLGELSRAGAIA